MATINPYRYAGYRYDEETKLYYLMARYYNPDTGVFLSLDPVRGDVMYPLTMNGYNYANNNPVMNVDPDGELAWAIVSSLVINVVPYVIKVFLKDGVNGLKKDASYIGKLILINTLTGFLGGKLGYAVAQSGAKLVTRMIVQFQYEFKMAIVGEAILNKGKNINYGSVLKSAVINTVGGEYLGYLKTINSYSRNWNLSKTLNYVKNIRL